MPEDPVPPGLGRRRSCADRARRSAPPRCSPAPDARISPLTSPLRLQKPSHFSAPDHPPPLLSDETLSMERIKELVTRAGDRQFVQTTFREAAKLRRRTGTSMVPVLLDELNTHAPKVDKEDVEPLLSALFEIHDQIDLEIDKDYGMLSFGDTSLRLHWLIRRLTAGRFTIDERTDLYMAATRQASLG